MTSSAQVSLRLSIQDAETVRAALEKLGTDGQAALNKLNNAGQQPAAGLKAVDSVASELSGRATALTGTLGIAGTALQALGPIGIAAGVVIGGLALVLKSTSDSGAELATKATQLRNFSEEVDLTTTQVQALEAEGAKLGLTSDTVSGSVQRFTVNLDALRRGSGALWDSLSRISPTLRDQLASTRDTATAWDLLAKAYQQAGDAATRNALSRAAFGRGGVSMGRLLLGTASDGGVSQLAASYEDAGRALDTNLIQRMAKLAEETKENEETAKRIWASTYSEAVLGRQLRFSEREVEIAKAARDILTAHKDAADLFDTFGVSGPGNYGSPEDAYTAQQRRKGFTSDLSKTGFEGYRRSSQDVQTATTETATTAAVQLAQYHELTGGLGATITAAQKLQGEQIKLKADFEAGKLSAEGYQKGLAALNSEFARSSEASRLSVLGAAATPAEQLKLKLDQLTETARKAGVSHADLARGIDAVRLASDQSIVSVRERLGVASEEEIQTIALRDLEQKRSQGYVKNAQEMATAEQLVKREAEQTAESIRVKASNTPGLTQLGIDASHVGKTLDQTVTSSLNNFGDALVAIGTNSKNSADAFRDMGIQILTSAEQMIIKLTVLKPLADGLSAALGGSPGSGGGLFGALGIKFAEGGIMTARGPLPLRMYAGGGVASGPQMAIYGEGRQNEAYVPLPDGRSIPVTMQGGAGGGIPAETHLHVHVEGAIGDADLAKRIAAGATTAAHTVVGIFSRNGLPARLRDMNLRGEI